MAHKKEAAAKKKSEKAPKREGSRLKLLNLKTDSKDRAGLIANAKKYENGNLSAWLRRAGLKYRPA